MLEEGVLGEEGRTVQQSDMIAQLVSVAGRRFDAGV